MPKVVKAKTKSSAKKSSAKKSSEKVTAVVIHGKKKTPNVEQATARKIKYTKPRTVLYSDDTALTADMAKRLLGWKKVTKNGDVFLKDRNGEKVFCHHNVTNRPLYMTTVETLIQEILRKKWVFNGEPIIVGETGLILNGQHTLVALILAQQEWEINQERWSDYWKSAPVIDKLCVFGISEAEAIVNTMDTCKPRSLSDVLYRSHYFASVKSSERKKLSRILDSAIKTLWYRTGAMVDAHNPKMFRTHAESLDFVERHPKLLACVEHIHQENSDEEDNKKIAKYAPLGTASALLYLMGCSASDSAAYYEGDSRNESALNWNAYDKACEFWVLLSQGHESLKQVRMEISRLIEETGATSDERIGILIKAWQAWSTGNSVNKSAIKLKYGMDDDGWQYLKETPIVEGGIDQGGPPEAE